VSGGALITGAASAFPAETSQSALWSGFFDEHFSHRRSAAVAFASAGIETRHAAVNPLEEDVSAWSTGARMARFGREALPIAAAALSCALAEAGLRPKYLGMLAVASCTGYTTPGIDVQLADRLAMAPGLERLLVGHVGCHAALPGLGAVTDFARSRGRPAALVCVELPSLHVQPPTIDLDQIVSHALFSDAAAAVVVEPPRPNRPGGLELVDLAARTELSAAGELTWSVTDLGFRMTVSRRVPGVLAAVVGPLVDELLERNGLGRDDVDAWAVHPGGPRIVNAIEDALGLSEDALAITRRVLFEHGNCSSATILVVLDAVRRALGAGAGRTILALGFGPGVTAYGALLRTT